MLGEGTATTELQYYILLTTTETTLELDPDDAEKLQYYILLTTTETHRDGEKHAEK